MITTALSATIDGPFLINPKIHGDDRGWFQETFRSTWFDKTGTIVPSFVQDNHVLSTCKGVLRGLHFQFPKPQAKLVRVVEGAIFDVAVDIRRASPTFGKHVSVELSAENNLQLFVPHGFAHGYLTLSDRTQVLYKVDAYYEPAFDQGLLWNDPALGIDWGLDAEVLLSEKDQRWSVLSKLDTPF